MSTEPGATVQTQYTSTQMLSDHCDKSVTEEQAPAKPPDTHASFQIFHVAALDLLTGTAGNRSPQELRQAQLSVYWNGWREAVRDLHGRRLLRTMTTQKSTVLSGKVSEFLMVCCIASGRLLLEMLLSSS